MQHNIKLICDIWIEILCEFKKIIRWRVQIMAWTCLALHCAVQTGSPAKTKNCYGCDGCIMQFGKFVPMKQCAPAKTGQKIGKNAGKWHGRFHPTKKSATAQKTTCGGRFFGFLWWTQWTALQFEFASFLIFVETRWAIWRGKEKPSVAWCLTAFKVFFQYRAARPHVIAHDIAGSFLIAQAHALQNMHMIGMANLL